jgi:protein-disulfide isomerase
VHNQLAAEAAEAAGAQGRFWEMHDYLFENRPMLDIAQLTRCAGMLGVDVERFPREMEERAHALRVREDFLSGGRSGVGGTPTFFINGVRVENSGDLSTLQAAIEALESRL